MHFTHSYPPVGKNEFIQARFVLWGGDVCGHRERTLSSTSVSALKTANPSPYCACIDRICPVGLLQASMNVDGPVSFSISELNHTTLRLATFHDRICLSRRHAVDSYNREMKLLGT